MFNVKVFFCGKLLWGNGKIIALNFLNCFSIKMCISSKNKRETKLTISVIKKHLNKVIKKVVKKEQSILTLSKYNKCVKSIKLLKSIAANFNFKLH